MRALVIGEVNAAGIKPTAASLVTAAVKAAGVTDMLLLGQEFHACWYSAGPHSKKGHPHHPLYLRGDSKLVPFDVQQYIKNCLPKE